MNKSIIYFFIIIVIIIIFLFIKNLISTNKKAVELYKKARLHSRQQNKKLLVLGSPTSMSGKLFSYFTEIYGCGDICIDMNCCKNCDKTICDKVENILHKFPSNKYIIFESGLFEVVDKDKLNYIINQMYRIAGSKNNIYSFHHIQYNKFYYQYIWNYLYKLINEGNINRFIIEYPPNNYYKYINIS